MQEVGSFTIGSTRKIESEGRRGAVFGKWRANEWQMRARAITIIGLVIAISHPAAAEVQKDPFGDRHLAKLHPLGVSRPLLQHRRSRQPA
jgi:hypothetical protein